MAQETFTDISREDLRQAQKIMLYIMKKIHEVCVKHTIRYWLDYGTLLGAIRHDGFIPWDDDLDIGMMREDYEKFNKVAQAELGDEFFWQTPETDPGCIYEMGKVRLNETIWLEKDCIATGMLHFGLFIDVFPMDPFPANALKRKFMTFLCDKIYRRIILYKIFLKTSPSFFKRTIMQIVTKSVPLCVLKSVLRKTVTNLQKYKNKSCLVSKICLDTKRDLCDKSMFDELVLHKFEDVEFYVPARYDERLKMLFNNYMQLPPEDKRYGHHGILKYDFGKYKDL